MNTRYLFVKDWLSMGELDIKHRPEELMVAEFLIKPLQGARFWWFQEMVINIDPYWKKLYPQPMEETRG